MNLWEYAAQTAQEATQGAQEGAERISIAPLLREQERRPEAEERALAICKEKQAAIAESEAARTSILKGIQAGEPAAKLLLLAVDCIGRITGDSVFAAQSRADLVTVYGKALMQPEALQIELEGIQARLAMLTRPELDAEPEDSRRRIQAAIRAHKKREAEIMAFQFDKIMEAIK